MNKYNFDLIADRKNTDSIKYQEENILPMWVADMDFKVLPEIVEAIKEKANNGCSGYVDILNGYYESYQSWIYDRYDINLPLEYFIYSTGVVATIDSIFKHLCKKGDKVMLFTPIYHTFFHCIEHNNLTLEEFQLDYNERYHQYHLDFDKLESSLKDNNIKILLLCNPHNPTGHIYSLQELENIVTLCNKYHVLLISDEIHGDITSPIYLYNPIFKLDHKLLDNVIVLTAPTKAFNLASLHTSVAIIKDEKLRELVQEGLYQDDVGEPNYFSCVATIAAYKYGKRWNLEMRQYIENNKDYCSSYLLKELPHLHIVEGNATYLIWVDISYYSHDSKDFSLRLKKETGLMVSSGDAFHGNGNNFIRINLATSLHNVKDALNRLKVFLKK